MSVSQQFEKWVGLGGKKPSNNDLADYLTRELENRENVDAIEAAVTREAVAALRAVEGSQIIANRATEYLREKEALLHALERMVGAFRPFTMKPMGGAGSAIRAEQDEQIAAHKEAWGALAKVRS